MTHKSVAAPTFCLAILCFLAGAMPSLASGPQVAHDLPLVPLDGPGFVRLTACVLLVEMSCQDADCILSVKQIYRLHNMDRVEEATLRLGVPSRVDGQRVRLPELTLQNQHGETLTPLGSSEQHCAIWEVKLDPNARESLVLSYVHPPWRGHFVWWRWEMSLLSSWKGVDGVRVAFTLPQHTADDAFLLLEPYLSAFDGTTLSWNYEKVESAPRHELLMLSPPTWRQLSNLRASGAHRELADLYMSIQEAARPVGVPFPDHFGQILGELEAALSAEPDDVATRFKLSELFRARADAMPEMRLNYLLLSAEELAKALQSRPGDPQLADALSRAYYDAAKVASETGDPGGALVYLRKAGEVPGSQAGQEYVNGEDLFLRWAVSLAEQGMVNEAMVQLDGVLSPGDQDALVRYAPPLVSVHTEVELSPIDRRARYSFRLYPTSADKTRVRIEEIASRLEAVEGCEVALRSGLDTSVLELRVPYDSLSELGERASDLLEALATDLDVVTSFVVAPWRSTPLAYAAEYGFLRDIYHYEERTDLTLLQDVCEAESEYARWRLIELRNSPPGDEHEQLWQRLALMALREQSRVWDRLPSGSYWTYRVGYGKSTETAPGMSWLLSWGQVRDLQASYSINHWSRIAAVLLIPAGGLALLLGILHGVRRRRTRSPSCSEILGHEPTHKSQRG